jgi:hypothetical protein
MLDDPGMNWKLLADRVLRTVTQPDYVLLIELASGAVLLAWMAHYAVE